MRVYIMPDLEGVSAIVKFDERNRKSPSAFERERWSRLLTFEVNPAISGAFESGATEVTLCDGHGRGDMLDLEKLDSRDSVVVGQKRKAWLPFFDNSYSALIMIGAHAKEGRPKGVLSHTNSHRSIKEFALNQASVGEIGISMAIAGWYNVPTVFISGDTLVQDRFLKSSYFEQQNEAS